MTPSKAPRSCRSMASTSIRHRPLGRTRRCLKRPRDDGIWLVSFMHYDLGYIDLEQRTLQTVDNPIGTRLSHHCLRYILLPMCPGRTIFRWSEWSDSNTRPPRPERGALPGCATLRDQRRFYKPAD